MIHLLGPGGAGKSTAGAALAQRLRRQFVDLDAEFRSRHGDISAFLEGEGYQAYAHQNVQRYLTILAANPGGVLALSSGFMTYATDCHPDYAEVRQQIVSSPTAFVLLPSLDLECCVAETVRRQLQRPFARNPEREEEVIRERFPIYKTLPLTKVETDRPVQMVVADLVAAVDTARRLTPSF